VKIADLKKFLSDKNNYFFYRFLFLSMNNFKMTETENRKNEGIILVFCKESWKMWKKLFFWGNKMFKEEVVD